VSVELQRDKMHLRQDEQRNAKLEEKLMMVRRRPEETTAVPAPHHHSGHSINPERDDGSGSTAASISGMAVRAHDY
jgi:hypothetical protein